MISVTGPRVMIRARVARARIRVTRGRRGGAMVMSMV